MGLSKKIKRKELKISLNDSNNISMSKNKLLQSISPHFQGHKEKALEKTKTLLDQRISKENKSQFELYKRMHKTVTGQSETKSKIVTNSKLTPKDKPGFTPKSKKQFSSIKPPKLITNGFLVVNKPTFFSPRYSQNNSNVNSSHVSNDSSMIQTNKDSIPTQKSRQSIVKKEKVKGKNLKSKTSFSKKNLQLTLLNNDTNDNSVRINSENSTIKPTV